MLSKGDFYIMIGCFFHLCIWLFVALGGFFSNKILYFNLFIVLPLIYFAQTQNNHPITKQKIKYILNNKDEFKEPQPFVSYCYNKVDPKEVEHLQKELGGTKEDIIRAILIVQGYENCLGIPYIVTYAYRNFCDSYRNPFDPQGFIVLAYILNSLAFLSKHYNLVLKEVGF